MTGWALFFEIVGVGYCVTWFMRFVIWLDNPRKKSR